LHLAAQFGRQEVYDILLKTYSTHSFLNLKKEVLDNCFPENADADANMRDHSGKKPMQYLVRQDASMSMDTFKSEISVQPRTTRAVRRHSTASNISLFKPQPNPELKVSLPICNEKSSLKSAFNSLEPTNPPPSYKNRNSSSPVQLLSFISSPNGRKLSISSDVPNDKVLVDNRSFPVKHAIIGSSYTNLLPHASFAGESYARNANLGKALSGGGFRSSFRRGLKNLTDNATPKSKKAAAASLKKNDV